MKKYFVVIILSLILTSCEKGKFKYVASLNQSLDYQLNKSGTFSEIQEKSSVSIAKDLLDLNLGEAFRVTKVNVRDVKLNFNFVEGSNATALDVNLLVTDRTGKEEITFANVSKSNLPLPGSGSFAQFVTTIGINNWLSKNGVDLVKRVVEESLINTNNFSNEGVIMRLNGKIPDGEVLKALLKVKYTIDIEYETCEDVPFGFAASACVES